ncbi:MAG: hypothetical protein JRG91_14290, partial [Deltaproteobacteria bacterium]|nr:hypothetical protein [Deltaproteobacteria bacterium]
MSLFGNVQKATPFLLAVLLAASCGGQGQQGRSDADDDADADDDFGGDLDVVEEETCVPVDETCNYEDDDCDGVIDNGFDLLSDGANCGANCGACGIECGGEHTTAECVLGVCLVTGCEDGWYDIDGDPYNGCEYECTATLSEESTDDGSCSDGLDNDCDGRIDDEDPDCESCVPEFCNELDDDCDVLVDEDFDLRTDVLNCGSCGTVCGYRPHASPSCVLGECSFVCEEGWTDLDGDPLNGCEEPCVPVPEGSEYECNGLDEDCDGLVDEDYIAFQCGVGACETDSVCAGGVETCVPLDPATDTDTLCDGEDNDCDGSVDEDFEPISCVGACVDGATCILGTEVCGDPAEVLDATCDGLDGDCDGSVDEDYVVYTCGMADSVCTGGVESCTAGSPLDVVDMTCDDVDDDCDGVADDNYVPTTCGVGECEADSECTGGAVTCTPLTPSYTTDEVCNDLDEDCDGSVDEDYVSYTCGTGYCEATSVCVSGLENCTPGTALGSVDTTCDGVDDDCDGSFDEEYVPYSCGAGICQRDSVCSGGADSCSPGSPSSTSDLICDGRDEDCDGSTDEDYVTLRDVRVRHRRVRARLGVHRRRRELHGGLTHGHRQRLRRGGRGLRRHGGRALGGLHVRRGRLRGGRHVHRRHGVLLARPDHGRGRRLRRHGRRLRRRGGRALGGVHVRRRGVRAL